jgi:hypothetical protein
MARPEAYVLGPLLHRGRPRVSRWRLGAALLLLAVVTAVPLAVLLGTRGEPATAVEPQLAAPSSRLLPGGPPEPQVIALGGDLRIYLPIEPSRVTAIGYHAAGEAALPLDPVGSQLKAGTFAKLRDRIFGEGGSGGVRYALIDGGVGPSTGGLNVGAAVGTNVYSPVDGTVIGISDVIVSGAPYGQRLDIQPSGSPGLVVKVSRIEADPSLEVGRTVQAAKTLLGSVVDLSSVETSALARFTQDRGQHVHLQVEPAANSLLP